MPETPAYAGVAIALATRHGKERVLARPLARGLGARLVRADVDTDALGSFDGRRPRTASAPDTCRRKAEWAIEASGLAHGLASEGSFGPHPQVPLLPVGEEWLVFVDRQRDLVVQERLVARRTNFAHQRLAPGDDPTAWLQRIGHPSHGVIVRPSQPAESSLIWRDCDTLIDIQTAIDRAASASGDGLALLETDMRAHRNPTRMASIRQLGFRLVRRLASACPACGSPGFGLVATIAGLPCAWCGTATELVCFEELGCSRCAHRMQQPRRDRRCAADPGHCPACNP